MNVAIIAEEDLVLHICSSFGASSSSSPPKLFMHMRSMTQALTVSWVLVMAMNWRLGYELL
eukprot:9621985-Heterocapsa_arctica.AAC.1